MAVDCEKTGDETPAVVVEENKDKGRTQGITFVASKRTEDCCENGG